MKTLSSIKDPLVVSARALAKAGERIQRRSCLAWGREAVGWALESLCGMSFGIFGTFTQMRPLEIQRRTTEGRGTGCSFKSMPLKYFYLSPPASRVL